ncbi:MAG TPA: zinc ribbon domain-containing protein [Actinomycetota bacterium]|nr:zinc ribbon domain-containing protein [Actinomycetota bacterium]
MMGERRCPACGALASADAEWCGQCFSPLERVRARTEAEGPVTSSRTGAAEPRAIRGRSGGAIGVEGGTLAWTCPVCETRNPIDANACSACGTPFGRLLAEPTAATTSEIEPQTAAVWSMLWPGLGHWKLGRRTDAVGRFVMFAWSFGALLILLVSRFGKGGLGPTFPLFALFLGASVLIYVVSATDAYRLAAGDEPLISSRTLLWTSAGLVFLSVLIATFVILPAARR